MDEIDKFPHDKDALRKRIKFLEADIEQLLRNFTDDTGLDVYNLSVYNSAKSRSGVIFYNYNCKVILE
jgi:hypothetical protein